MGCFIVPRVGERGRAATELPSIRCALTCPGCSSEHSCGDLCHGPSHLCTCGQVFEPFVFPVVGRGRSEGQSDAMVCYSDGNVEGFEGVGFYWYDLDNPSEGVAGAFLSLEEAARDALSGESFGRVRFDPEALVAAGEEVAGG